jgi:hypothetical protein
MHSPREAYGIHRAFRPFVPRVVAARVKRRGANPQSPILNPDGAIPPCRLVFIGGSVIYSFYRDPSPALRMTVEGGAPQSPIPTFLLRMIICGSH